jgi:RNA polymerase sigma factor (sigma-70 family)
MAFFKKYDEESLIQACCENRRDAQEQLYKKYFPLGYNMCQKRGINEDQALEIINDGFLKVFKKIHTFRHEGSFEGWVRRVFFHALADYYKKVDHGVPLIFPEIFPDNESGFAEVPILYGSNDLIQEALNKIPESSREAFRLFALEGYSHQEIATMMGFSEGTSKWHVSQARSILKKWWAEHYKNVLPKNIDKYNES